MLELCPAKNYIISTHRLMAIRILYATLLLSFLFSCTKDKPETSLYDGKSTVIENLAGDTGASLTDGVDGKEKRDFYPFLFNLSDRKQLWLKTAADSARYMATEDWDLAFTGIYNSSVYVNNGAQAGNPGYGSNAGGQVIVVDEPYAQVTEAPSDAVFSASDIKIIGQKTNETPDGWFMYNSVSHIVQPIKSRTYVIKFSDGKYAKLELLNVYKNNPPVVTDLYWPAPYYTFRYFVQTDGSRNLSTK